MYYVATNRLMNTKAKTNFMFLFAAIMVTGTRAMTIPKSLADPEYSCYEEKYAKDPRAFGKDIWDKS